MKIKGKWLLGEIGFSAARNLFEKRQNKFSVGTSLKLLFPGSYTNFGADFKEK
jgi:hypothetical protein